MPLPFDKSNDTGGTVITKALTAALRLFTEITTLQKELADGTATPGAPRAHRAPA